MNDDYLIIHKKVLPDYYSKVIQIKKLLLNKVNVSEACKIAGLSRSTYYKYKDFVHRPTLKEGKRVILSLKLLDEKGVLSNILNYIANHKGNILAINQEMPIHNIAFLTLTIDAFDMMISIQGLVSELRHLNEVMDVMLIAVE